MLGAKIIGVQLKEDCDMDDNAKGVVAGLIFFVGFLFVLGLIGTGDPECSMSGCDKDAKDGSSYCYLHAMSYRSYGDPDCNRVYENSQNNRQNSSSSSSSSSGSYSSGSGSTSSSNKYSTYSSYDDGYDDVYEDGDYDWDRYYEDDDYATGVDDAMDDCDEDW